MGKLFYLDSNVFISFVREEMDSAFNLRFVDSERFFALCRKEKHVLLLSGLFFKEVKKVISLDKSDILEEFERHGIPIACTENIPSKELVSSVIKESRIHLADAVHVALAYESNADAIISWNKKDFAKSKNFVKCSTPQEILDMI